MCNYFFRGRLDSDESCVHVSRVAFCLFFFFFWPTFVDFGGTNFTVMNSKYTVYVLYWHCSRIKKILKMGSTVLFTHLKIILLQCFQFSVFNFSNNKFNPNGPITRCFKVFTPLICLNSSPGQLKICCILWIFPHMS